MHLRVYSGRAWDLYVFCMPVNVINTCWIMFAAIQIDIHIHIHVHVHTYMYSQTNKVLAIIEYMSGLFDSKWILWWCNDMLCSAGGRREKTGGRCGVLACVCVWTVRPLLTDMLHTEIPWSEFNSLHKFNTTSLSHCMNSSHISGIRQTLDLHSGFIIQRATVQNSVIRKSLNTARWC